MALLTEGTWPCTIVDGMAGDSGGIITVRINVQITDGPDKGRRCTYEDTVNTKSAPYIGRSCKAAGWRGGSLTTLADDIAKATAKAPIASMVEVRHIEIKKGKKYDAWVAAGSKPANRPIWDKVNSIGRGPKPLAPAQGEALKDADDAMRAAMAEIGDNPPPDADFGGNAAGPDDEIPF